MALAYATMLALAAPAHAQLPTLPDQPGTWIPNAPLGNGTIDAMAVDGTTMYIGGSFTYIGPQTESLARLDAADGTADEQFPRFEAVPVDQFEHGGIFAIEPDGNGGWYVGGAFDRVGTTQRANLAHIDADGQPDSWSPAPSGVVRALKLVNGTLYVGGDFQSVGDQVERLRLAAYDTAAGDLLPWSPDIADGSVRDLASDGTNLYAVGTFTDADGTPRPRAAAFDSATGALTPWNPAPDAAVDAVDAAGGVVYLAGAFANAGGSPRAHLAAIAGDGTATTWNPAPNQEVQDVQVVDGMVWICGDFNHFGDDVDRQRNSIAALDPVTGEPNGFSRSRYGIVRTFAVTAEHVYAYSTFFANNEPHSRVTSFDRDTGAIDGFDDALDYGYDWAASVRAIEPAGSSVLVGGSFFSIGGVDRQRMAAIDLSTGRATAFDPGPDGRVTALAVSGGTLYAGGYFTNVAGTARNRAAAFATADGSLTSWDPNVNGNVWSVTPSGGSVYLGGAFDTVGAATRSRIARVAPDDGSVDAGWSPSVTGSMVDDIAVQDGAVYFGGAFTSVDGSPRASAAAVGVADGSLLPWDPTLAGSSNPGLSVIDITPDPDRNRVFVAGQFSQAGGVARNSVAAVDPVTGTPTSWHFDVSTQQVSRVIPTASAVYLAGMQSPVRNIIAFTPPPANTSSPWIEGELIEGSVLTCHVGAWEFDPTAFATTWERDGAMIGGATGGQYSVVAADAGHGLTCTVTATNTSGSVVATSAPAGTGPPPAIVDAPTVTGTVGLGSDIACTTGNWSGPPTSFGYQWLRNGNALDGATSAVLHVAAGNGGHQLSCQVTAAGPGGSAQATSAGVTMPVGPAMVTTASIIYDDGTTPVGGRAPVGSTLRCDPGSWSGSPSFAYQWVTYGGPETIQNGGETLAASATDKTRSIACQVTATNAGDQVTIWTSAIYVPGDPPVNTVPPAILGTVRAGNEITCNSGSWAQSDWSSPEWRIDGQFANYGGFPLLLTEAHVGHVAACVVTANNSEGATVLSSPEVLVLEALPGVDPGDGIGTGGDPDTSDGGTPGTTHTDPPVDQDLGTFAGESDPPKPPLHSTLRFVPNPTGKVARNRSVELGRLACAHGTLPCRATVGLVIGRWDATVRVAVGAGDSERLVMRVPASIARRVARRRPVMALVTIRIAPGTAGSPRSVTRRIRL